MNILNIIIPPVLGGLIALSTNWLAIKMLFRPHKAKYILGVRVPFTPGLIPKERARLATKLAEAISMRLLTPDVLASELSDPTIWPLPDITIGEALATLGIDDISTCNAPVSDKLKLIADKLLPQLLERMPTFLEQRPELDAKLEEFTGKIVDENVGTLAGMFISKSKIYNNIKQHLFTQLCDPSNYEPVRSKLHNGIDALLAHPQTQSVINEKLLNFNIRDGFSQILQKEKQMTARALEVTATYIAKHMPIQTMIENKLAAFDVAEAEQVILTVAGRELRMIIILGGVLGFIIGGLMLVF